MAADRFAPLVEPFVHRRLAPKKMTLLSPPGQVCKGVGCGLSAFGL